jgi:hypothetical protein
LIEKTIFWIKCDRTCERAANRFSRQSKFQRTKRFI